MDATYKSAGEALGLLYTGILDGADLDKYEIFDSRDIREMNAQLEAEECQNKI